jgi:4-hydroxy-3-polyprenylbenzoate decarboxylase
MSRKRYILAISGASGAFYARRALEALLASDAEVHVLASPTARLIWQDELQSGSLEDFISSLPATQKKHLHLENCRNLGAGIASGSFRHDGMLILPCSVKCLAAIANGFSSNLIERAADVCLKEKFPLVIGLRETPLSTIHLENALKAAQAGATIMPCMPAFYHEDNSFEGLINFVSGKALDQLGVEHQLYKRWKQDT